MSIHEVDMHQERLLRLADKRYRGCDAITVAATVHAGFAATGDGLEGAAHVLYTRQMQCPFTEAPGHLVVKVNWLGQCDAHPCR